MIPRSDFDATFQLEKNKRCRDYYRDILRMSAPVGRDTSFTPCIKQENRVSRQELFLERCGISLDR